MQTCCARKLHFICQIALQPPFKLHFIARISTVLSKCGYTRAGGSLVVSLKYVFTAQCSPLPAAASPVFHSFVALLCPRFRQYALTYEVCYRAEDSFTVSFLIGFAIKVDWEK